VARLDNGQRHKELTKQIRACGPFADRIGQMPRIAFGDTSQPGGPARLAARAPRLRRYAAKAA
jgi:hypothetical protein